MCGIAGVVRWRGNTPALESAARSMTDALVHRGPDGEGTWIDGTEGVALGHRRLAIIDLSEHGRQPMTSADGRWVITYNGELYNYRTIRAELESKGVAFRGASDTEVLVEAIAHWGVLPALEKSDGMFAIGLWDRRERELWLARDRFGEKPLAWFRHGDGIAFASEVRSLQQLRECPTSLDPRAVEDLLHRGYIAAPRTILAGVEKCPPGSALHFGAGGSRPVLHRWWDPVVEFRSASHDRLDSLSLDDAADRVEACLLESVYERLVSDVPIGAFLSGGIDSSLIVAMMTRVATGSVRTFTVGFEDDAINEAEFARAIAGHLGTEHTEVQLSAADALHLVPRIASHYDEPFADSSQIATQLLCAVTRRHVTVALSGDAGDELFGGYNRHVLLEHLWPRIAAVPRPLRSGAAVSIDAVPDALLRHVPSALLRRLPGSMGTDPAGRVRKAASLASLPDADAAYHRLTQLRGMDHEPRRRDRPHPLSSLQLDHASDAERAMVADVLGYLPGDILTKVDRAAMSVSLETRVPFLDPALYRLAASLPSNLKVHHGESKRVLRHLLARHVPRALFERPKMGFAVPLGAWLDGPLAEWAGDMLTSARELAPIQLYERASQSLDGRWALISLAMWASGTSS